MGMLLPLVVSTVPCTVPSSLSLLGGGGGAFFGGGGAALTGGDCACATLNGGVDWGGALSGGETVCVLATRPMYAGPEPAVAVLV